ncbi:hypothetical protein GLYMA_13G319100v4 [Glycine max]|uniref:Uncharacterized protein n=1 Tax=Glycine max TaxID=3847 RepID=A0A0R0GX45_SOYBN|nr:hypothetical protein GYH30_038007 [Glycine max]KAH1104374.1 hypothetical protein GYH30_038007 [Glycine max]KRH22726.1 hypothetical protein GLYMA_13G319100v4 [Glycine max]KRH22727.1 hypothetical protein GLYMA_13G319100v4 [Glycine max]
MGYPERYRSVISKNTIRKNVATLEHEIFPSEDKKGRIKKAYA